MTSMTAASLITVVPSLLFGAAVLSGAVMVLSLQKKCEELRRRMATLEDTANAALNDFEQRIDDLARRLVAAEELPPPAPVQQRPGLNLTNRAQALRMLRRGVKAETIAASLNLPRPEIELLIRVQELSEAADGSTSESPG